jgi:hypothetical protein
MSRARTKLAIVAGTLIVAGLMPASASSSAGLVPGGPLQATSSVEVETLVAYTKSGKLKAQRRIAYTGVCSADCNVTAQTTLVLPGPNVTPGPVSGTFPAGQGFEAFLKLNKAGAAFLKENKSKAKLRTKITAVNTVTGDTDTDQRVFKFK